MRAPAKRRWPNAATGRTSLAALVLTIGNGVGTNMGKDAPAPWAGMANTCAVSADGSEQFVRQAIAHVVYRPAVDCPIDIGKEREQEFVQYLSKKLGPDAHPVMLANNGSELMGGRLLPGDDRPAQIM